MSSNKKNTISVLHCSNFWPTADHSYFFCQTFKAKTNGAPFWSQRWTGSSSHNNFRSSGFRLPSCNLCILCTEPTASCFWILITHRHGLVFWQDWKRYLQDSLFLLLTEQEKKCHQLGMESSHHIFGQFMKQIQKYLHKSYQKQLDLLSLMNHSAFIAVNKTFLWHWADLKGNIVTFGPYRLTVLSRYMSLFFQAVGLNWLKCFVFFS